jgi:hypothetical protein
MSRHRQAVDVGLEIFVARRGQVTDRVAAP